jgi:Mce-associated membrane protein
LTSTPTAKQAVRRRASRAAGPTSDKPVSTTAVRVEASTPEPRPKPARKVGAPPRRQAHRRLVAIAGLVFGLVAAGAMAATVAVMLVQQRHVDAADTHNQRYVDTASQTVVNMFSFKQDSLEDSVNRFYNGTSGPLRDMLSQNNNVANLKAMFRDTGSSSEAVINGAALEGVDPVSGNASVLVSARVTVSDPNGNNRPSQPYRMRIVVHEDDSGRMSAWDLKYPNGGN